MKTILDLLHLQIDNKTDILKTKTPTKMAIAFIKAIVLVVALTLGVALALVQVLSVGFRVNAELLAIIMAATQMVSLCFAIGTVISTLYLAPDTEMLICLPVTPNQLFLSKALLIYLKEIAVNASIFCPIFITLGFVGNYGVSFYLAIPIYLLILPIVPIALASFLSIPIMAVMRFLKPRPKLSIIIMLVLVSATLAGYSAIVGSFADTFNIANQQLETVRRINAAILSFGGKIFVYLQLAKAMTSFSSWYFIPVFMLISAMLAVITVLVIKPLYFNTAMTTRENTIKEKKKVGRFKKRSPFVSLIEREILTIFRSPSEIFEYFLFTLLMPFIVYLYDKLLMSLTVNQAGVNMIAGSHIMIVAIMAMLSNIVSASAISREGSNFHTSKTIPVDYFTQVFAKFTFNAIFTLSALAVTMIVSFFIYPAWQIILGIEAIAFAAIGHIAWSIDMDIKSPSINMQGDEQSSTASKSTPKSLLSGLIIGFVLGLIIIMTSGSSNSVVPYILIGVLSFVFAVYRIWMLVLRINLAYDRIEM